MPIYPKKSPTMIANGDDGGSDGGKEKKECSVCFRFPHKLRIEGRMHTSSRMYLVYSPVRRGVCMHIAGKWRQKEKRKTSKQKENENQRTRTRQNRPRKKNVNGKIAFSCVKEDFSNFIGLLLYIVSLRWNAMPSAIVLHRFMYPQTHVHVHGKSTRMYEYSFAMLSLDTNGYNFLFVRRSCISWYWFYA